MTYLKIIKNYPPYALMADKRGFISQFYGHNGHTGVDSVGNQWANPVCSIIDGTAVASYSGALGNILTVTNGEVQVLFYHLAKITKTGTVKAGEQVAIEGNTGTLANKQKHLHISIKIGGKLVDPIPYLTGAQKLPVMQKSQIDNALSGAQEGKYMIRKVTKALNLRSTRSLANNSNLVYGNMPVGTVFLVTETKIEGNITWGHAIATIGGKTYAGWCNIAATWSAEV